MWDVLLVMYLIEEGVLDGLLSLCFFIVVHLLYLFQKALLLSLLCVLTPIFLQEDRFTGDIDGVQLVKGIIDPFVVFVFGW